MNDNVVGSLVTVATAIIGVAIIAVLVSRQAQTSQVIQSAGSAFAQDLSAAVSPVTGGAGGFGSGYGSSFGGFSGQGAPFLGGNY